MLSILIPVYNYNVIPLVFELQKQCVKNNIIFEIIVCDDGSTHYTAENQKINDLENCHFFLLENNIGRSTIRNLLSQKAQYDALLFLDSDIIPIQDDFIKTYVEQINNDEKIVYGGIEYQKEKPKENQILRWKYGHAREALSVAQRQKNPYLSFLTLNFLIHKNIFKKVSFNETIPNLRHEDTLFSYNLMQENIKIEHISNPVYHFGLDTFENAIRKENESLIALKYLTDTQLLPYNYTKISKIVLKIQKLKMIGLFAFFFKITQVAFLKNLSSSKPSLFIFDLYKLGYLCHLKKNKAAPIL